MATHYDTVKKDHKLNSEKKKQKHKIHKFKTKHPLARLQSLFTKIALFKFTKRSINDAEKICFPMIDNPLILATLPIAGNA